MESRDQVNFNLNQKIVFGGHAAPIYSLSFSNSKGQIFSASGDRIVTSWNLETGLNDSFSIKVDHTPYCIQFITEHQLLAIGLSNGSIHIIDVANKQEIRHLKLHEAAIFDIQIVDGKMFVTTSNSEISIWNLPDFTLIKAISLNSGKIRKVNFWNDQMILGCESGEIRIVDFKLFQETFRYQAHDSACNVAIKHPSKDIIISGGKDAHIRISDPNTREELYAFPAHQFAIYELKADLENNVLISVSRDKTIKIWDLKTFDLIQKIDHHHAGHNRSVNTMILDSENQLFFTAGDDQKIIGWNYSKTTS